MTNELYFALQQWQQDPTSNRVVTITWGGVDSIYRNREEIYVRDCDLRIGTYIKTIEELEALDLRELKRKQVFQEWEEINGKEAIRI
jgi:hypothetical protein